MPTRELLRFDHEFALELYDVVLKNERCDSSIIAVPRNGYMLIMANIYDNGKIYAIKSHSRPDLVYIGSTTQQIDKRHAAHVTNTTRGYKLISSSEIIKLGDSYVELVESFPCASKKELTRREGEIIRATVCVNRNIAGRTTEEYLRDNAEKIAREQSVRSKEWYQKNIEKARAVSKNWVKANPGRVKDRAGKPHLCECGAIVIHSNISTHKRSPKHLTLMDRKTVLTCVFPIHHIVDIILQMTVGVGNFNY